MDINTIANWYLSVLKKYAVFDGRASRVEYWTFALLSIALSIGLSVISGFALRGYGMMGGGLNWLYSLAIFVPSLAVSMRRLHDINKSGWWLLLGLIPIIGPLVLLILMVQKGDPGENDFGVLPRSKPENILKL